MHNHNFRAIISSNNIMFFRHIVISDYGQREPINNDNNNCNKNKTKKTTMTKTTATKKTTTKTTTPKTSITHVCFNITEKGQMIVPYYYSIGF